MGNRLAGAGAAVGDAGTAALMKAQQVNNEYRISEKAESAFAYASKTAHDLDEKYKITDKVQAAANTAAAKASEIDEKYAVSETAAAKAAELDKKYAISGKADAASKAAASALGSFFGGGSSMTDAAKKPS